WQLSSRATQQLSSGNSFALTVAKCSSSGIFIVVFCLGLKIQQAEALTAFPLILEFCAVICSYYDDRRLKKNSDPFQKRYNHFWCLIFGS
nr:hypothetical protein [Tanacetum cinerariifolium]